MYLYKTTWYARKQIMLINPLYLISITINQKVCYLVDLVVNIYDTVEFCSIVIKKNSAKIQIKRNLKKI